MTGLRAIEETIPSTLHTLFRSLRLAHFREAFPRSVRMCNKVRTKYDVCVRIHIVRVTAVSLGTIENTFRVFSFLFFFFQVAINRPRVIGPLSRKHRACPFTLTDRMLRRAYCVKAGKFTDDTYVRYTRRGLVIRQRSAYRSVTNSGTTRPGRSGSRKRPELESHVHDAARHRLRFTRQVMIPLRGTETVKISSSFGRVRRRMYVRTERTPGRQR